MLHTKIKIFSYDPVKENETPENLEQRVNRFIADKNIKNIIRLNDTSIMVHFTDSTY